MQANVPAESMAQPDSAAAGVVATARALGLSEYELIDRVVDRVASMVIETAGLEDEEGARTHFGQLMTRRVAKKVDEAIDNIAGRNVLPNVAQYVEGLTLQETNRWGEKTGKPTTFVEFLVARAEAYLVEEVDHDGKAQRDGGYSWRKSTTRIAHMVHQHLHYSIKSAMEKALANANSQIVAGIQKAVEIKLAEIAAQIKVQVKV